MKKSKVVLLISIILAISCRQPEFEFKKLEDFKFTPAHLKDGTRIELLAFSGNGGKDCEPEVSYYCQFIGINRENGDTVRILARCQQYDLQNTPRLGTFTSESTFDSILDSAALKIPQEGFTFSGKEKKYVVINNKPELLDLENKNFKTAIGTLAF